MIHVMRLISTTIPVILCLAKLLGTRTRGGVAAPQDQNVRQSGPVHLTHAITHARVILTRNTGIRRTCHNLLGAAQGLSGGIFVFKQTITRGAILTHTAHRSRDREVWRQPAFLLADSYHVLNHLR